MCVPFSREFAKNLEERTCLRVEMVDERLSTREAYERRDQLGGGDIDSLAAQIIAETWLGPR